MVHVVAESYVKAQDKEEYMKLVAQIIEGTRKEKGCVQYVMTNKGDAYVFIEKWETKEDLDNHLNSEHVKTIGPKMKAYRYEQKDVMILEEIM